MTILFGKYLNIKMKKAEERRIHRGHKAFNATTPVRGETKKRDNPKTISFALPLGLEPRTP